MSEKNNKRRVITIRVSDEEYETYQSTTRHKGYRNVSELIRAVLNAISREDLPPHQILAQRVDEQAEIIAALSRDVQQLLASSAATPKPQQRQSR